jgi:excisionase family DNA binding protein
MSNLLLNDEVMTSEEVMDFLKVSETLIYSLTRDGEIPARKVGREWRYLKSEILIWLKEKRMNETEMVKKDEWGGEYKGSIDNPKVALWLKMSLPMKEKLMKKAGEEKTTVSSKVEEFLKNWIA